MSALRTTGVAPILVRSTAGLPFAFSSRRIISPIIADSLESFEETTTAACSAGRHGERQRRRHAQRLQNFATRHPCDRSAAHDRASAAPCRLLPCTSSPRIAMCRPALRFYDAEAIIRTECQRVSSGAIRAGDCFRGSQRPARLRAPGRRRHRSRYRVVIVGGGGHGLATPSNLATDTALPTWPVLEKGPIGLGNVGAQHHHHPLQLLPPDNIVHEYSLKLWGRSRAS